MSLFGIIKSKLMNKEELQKKQNELDNEFIECPKCGNKAIWSEVREFGTCLHCYYLCDKLVK